MTQIKAHCGGPQFAGYFVGVGFLVVGGFFAISSTSVEIPQSEPVVVGHEQIVSGPWREAMTDPPMINIGTLNQRCSDCHTLFENIREPDRALQQHTSIRLEHGSNDACLNCHDKGTREKLTLRGGKVVGYDQVEQLCAQCHGPVYRDWRRGSHGKTLGYWDKSLGEAHKLSCTQCHDPHHPAYRPMEPLPGPRTLRMGDQSSGHTGDLIDDRNPLQRWRLLESASGESGGGGGHK